MRPTSLLETYRRLTSQVIWVLGAFTLVIGTAVAADEEKQSFVFKDYDKGKPLTEQSLETIRARSFLLVDANTGKVICERNADERHLPASTVKLMTGLITYETLGTNGSVTIVPDDLKVEPSWVPLRPGETVSVDVLLHALLIFSANDSARALARKVAGSDEAFVAMMNKKASDLGCSNTLYANPNGLPVPNEYTREYSSCRDLMKVFQAVISHPALRTICSTERYVISTQAGTKELHNHNLLLGKYPGMGPAKTGWTVTSRHTYAAAVDRIINGQKHELLLTLMDSPNKWADIPVLFNYGISALASGRLPDSPRILDPINPNLLDGPPTVAQNSFGASASTANNSAPSTAPAKPGQPTPAPPTTVSTLPPLRKVKTSADDTAP